MATRAPLRSRTSSAFRTWFRFVIRMRATPSRPRSASTSSGASTGSMRGDEITIGLVLGTGIAASVLFRPTVGALLDRLGRREVLLWSAAINAATLPLFLLVGSTGHALFLLSAVHFVVGGALFAAYFTYASDLVPAARRIEGIAIFGVAGMATNGLGPTLGELLIARGGYAAFFLVAAGFALVSFGLTALIPRVPRRTWAPHVAPLGA